MIFELGEKAMKNLIAITILLIQVVAQAGTYNGPEDKKYYRQPRELLCHGLPNYPKGADLTFSRDSYVGNLLDGFNYAHMIGKVGIIYFEDMTSTDGKTINGTSSEIDVLSNFRLKNKDLPIKCVVKKWY